MKSRTAPVDSTTPRRWVSSLPRAIRTPGEDGDALIARKLRCTYLKFNSKSPWTVTKTQKEKNRLPTIIFQGLIMLNFQGVLPQGLKGWLKLVVLDQPLKTSSKSTSNCNARGRKKHKIADVWPFSGDVCFWPTDPNPLVVIPTLIHWVGDGFLNCWVPSLKLTARLHLKMDGWKTSFWECTPLKSEIPRV